MRAVKGVLLTAASFKRNEPRENEEVLIWRALSDCNIPKLLSEDIPLFTGTRTMCIVFTRTGILSDLFPGVDDVPPDHALLEVALEEACKTHKLQPVPSFIRKCIELWETAKVRHGVM